MGIKRHKPEEIVTKMWQVEVLVVPSTNDCFRPFADFGDARRCCVAVSKSGRSSNS